MKIKLDENLACFPQCGKWITDPYPTVGATWKVIGSTAAMDAKDNIGTAAGVPVYRLDDLKVADDDADLWDGVGAWGDTPYNAIHVNEVGTTAGGGYVWTGTLLDGTVGSGPLGSADVPYPAMGDTSVVNWTWIDGGSQHGPTTSHPVYVIGGVLTIPAIGTSMIVR